MRSSLFAKYFSTCAVVILLCFIFLGAIVITRAVRSSNDQKIQFYHNTAQSLAFEANAVNTMYRNTYGSGTDVDSAIQQALQRDTRNFSKMMDANVFITDAEGNLITFSSPYGDAMSDINVKGSSQVTVSSAVMSEIKKGTNYQDLGLLGGLYTREYLTQASPITEYNSKTVIGAVFVSSRSDVLTSFISQLVRTYVFCLIIALAFAFVAIYLMTKRLVSPLRQMSAAAKSFAKGEFSIRVPIRDNDEVGQLAVSFNNMAASLTTLEDMRRSFVANVSHELKTPMTSIAGFIDGILDGTIPPEKQNYYLRIVSDEVKRLSRLVRQFLDIARIEAGEIKVNPSVFDVGETVRRVIIGFEQQIDAKHLEIRGLDENFDRRVMVRSDPDLTHQIIYNLVDNAVKFANENGYIEIKLAEGGKKVYVSVKNSGMGIPAADLPYVFDRFYKTDKSRSRDRKGVGLGLYIAKTVLNMQNEDIVVKSVEGEYCEFVFTLAAESR
jgi:signal transduction histidine kinase